MIYSLNDREVKTLSRGWYRWCRAAPGVGKAERIVMRARVERKAGTALYNEMIKLCGGDPLSVPYEDEKDFLNWVFNDKRPFCIEPTSESVSIQESKNEGDKKEDTVTKKYKPVHREIADDIIRQLLEPDDSTEKDPVPKVERPPIETIARWFYDWDQATRKDGDNETADKYYTRLTCLLGPAFVASVANIRAHAASPSVQPSPLSTKEVIACQKWFADAESKYLDEHGVHTSDAILGDGPKHLECLEKHLAYAEVLESESRSGYPANRRLVIGNLVAAEEHAKEDGEAPFAETLRQSRRAYQNEGTTPDFQGLFDLLRSVYAKV